MAEKDRFRTKQIHIKLTDEEYEILMQKCAEFNLTQAGYVRTAILFGSVQDTKPRVDENLIKQLVYEVNRIGNNINQIAYICNSKYEVTEREMIEAKDNLFRAEKYIVDVLNGLGE